ncbi:hypothetical protein CLV62_11815 [Dysgonomonas alginatilytica]|uniref:Uncharacterized protein n=1 Tax=Dysgonomonas alginatilytica TaxID=1605892 RepID=A0A2V3PLM6_9BACT|nr:hypothetical protein CLV62_11815 [Dysgonomonas alginatilytica]
MLEMGDLLKNMRGMCINTKKPNLTFMRNSTQILSAKIYTFILHLQINHTNFQIYFFTNEFKGLFVSDSVST